jgi:hypothetical protein
MRSHHLVGAVVVASLGLACSTQSGVQNAPLQAGIGRTYDASFDKTMGVAREAAIEAGLRFESATEMDPNTYLIMFKAPTSAWSWGEIVRVAVIRASDTQTTVRIYSKRKSAVNIAAKGDYSNTILSNIELKLKSTQ